MKDTVIKTASRVTVFAGNTDCMDVRPDVPFSDTAIDFLDTVSKSVRCSKAADTPAGLPAFGFWCRRAHILKLKKEYADGRLHFGKGCLFHICPSNVPGLFLWSAAMGLLCGNAGVVRVSERKMAETDKLCETLRKVMDQEAFAGIRERLAIISYPHEAVDITAAISEKCDGRIVWGGDSAAEGIRRISQHPLNEDIFFGDRSSGALFDAGYILDLSEDELVQLAGLFYNDTYAMDQNACSSPTLVLWLSRDEETAVQAQQRWWRAVSNLLAVYQLSERSAYDKMTWLCEAAIDYDVDDDIDIAIENDIENEKLLRIPLKAPSADWCSFRGSCGTFLEYIIRHPEDMAAFDHKRWQTLLLYGPKRQAMAETVVRLRMKGIDRIAMPGSAFEMDFIWDGKNLFDRMTRTIG